MAKPFFRQSYHRTLALAFAAWWVAMAINPVYPFDWFLENLLVAATVLLVALTYRRVPLSNVSYTLLALFLGFHVLGSHYTYAEAPPGFWMADLLGLERNHYDRVIHFSFGLLMFWPFREVARQVLKVSPRWDALVAWLCVISGSALYEAIEWLTAIIVAPEAGIAFLGTQGDVFDAQKDHVLAIAGGAVSMLASKTFNLRPAPPAAAKAASRSSRRSRKPAGS